MYKAIKKPLKKSVNQLINSLSRRVMINLIKNKTL